MERTASPGGGGGGGGRFGRPARAASVPLGQAGPRLAAWKALRARIERGPWNRNVRIRNAPTDGPESIRRQPLPAVLFPHVRVTPAVSIRERLVSFVNLIVTYECYRLSSRIVQIRLCRPRPRRAGPGEAYGRGAGGAGGEGNRRTGPATPGRDREARSGRRGPGGEVRKGTCGRGRARGDVREGTCGRKGARVAALRRPALNPRSGRLDYPDARGARALRGRSGPDRRRTAGCQGRRETRPRGGAKHCHRSRVGEVVVGGRDWAWGRREPETQGGRSPSGVSG